MAQLGARFHGMEEVDGSNPSRSTKTFHTLSASLSPTNLAPGVQLESKTHLTLGIRSHPVPLTVGLPF